MGWDWVLAVATSSGNQWRLGRRMLDRGLRPSATTSYQPIMQAKTHTLLSWLLETPNQWEAHIDLSVRCPSDLHHSPKFVWRTLSFQGELILAVTYGHRKYERDDRLLADSRRRIKFATDKIHPGGSLINHVPLCMCFFVF